MNVEPRVAGPQAEPAVTSQPTPATAPRVLDTEQRALLRSTLNCIIPARAGLAGAGDLDVGASIERTLSQSAHLRRLFFDGLKDIEISTQRGSRQAFMDLAPARQTAVLEMVERAWPAFFVALIEHAYRGYYTLPEAQRATGWQPRPPQPLGYDLPAFDPSLLEQQRARAPFWRKTS